MPIIGLLRVKNEARWIRQVVSSILPICERVIVLDDHSTDATPQICYSAGATVYWSPFTGCDESRDKDFLLSKAYKYVPDKHKLGNPESCFWALLIDGDEVLHAADMEKVKGLVDQGPDAFSFKIQYLWDQPTQIRVDGVYANFRRPSMFRLMNHAFRFQKTPHGGNFHCSSIPQEMLHCAAQSDARLLHYGYLHQKDRLRKYAWYNQMDPNNIGEDCYRHMVIGDTFPAESKFRWAGPLVLAPLSD